MDPVTTTPPTLHNLMVSACTGAHSDYADKIGNQDIQPTSGERGDNGERDVSWARSFLRGLNATVTGNAQAFGFSILITVSYGVVSATHGAPSRIELIGFALSAVAAFSLLNLVVAFLTSRRQSDSESTRVVLIATAADFLAVGAGVGAAFGANMAVGGWSAWLLTPYAAGLIYVLVHALELGMGSRKSVRR